MNLKINLNNILLMEEFISYLQTKLVDFNIFTQFFNNHYTLFFSFKTPKYLNEIEIFYSINICIKNYNNDTIVSHLEKLILNIQDYKSISYDNKQFILNNNYITKNNCKIIINTDNKLSYLSTSFNIEEMQKFQKLHNCSNKEWLYKLSLLLFSNKESFILNIKDIIKYTKRYTVKQ